MKRLTVWLLILLCIPVLAGCTSGTDSMHQEGIMVDGAFYEIAPEPMPAEIDESAIIGYVASYTEGFPQRDWETNVSDGLVGSPIARVEGGIAVLYQNEWYLCQPESVR